MATNEENENQKNLFYSIVDVARYILGAICFGVAMITIEIFDFRTILYLLASIGLFPITYKIISKKIVIKYLWQVIIGLSLFGIAYFSDEIYTKNMNSITDYYSTTKVFANDVLTSGVKLEVVGNDITSYWRDYIYDDKYDSIEDAVAKALSDNEYNINLLKSNHSTIKFYYSKLLIYPESCVYCEELKLKVEDLYSSYKKMYDLIIDPTGSYNDFTRSFSNCDTELANKYDEIITLLKVYHN